MDRKAKTRDDDALFASIYHAYAPAVLAYARRRTNAEDAADVVSETFVVAWRRIGDIPDEPKVKPWLYGVARRVLANKHRGNRRRGELARKVSTMIAPQLRNVPSIEPQGDAQIVFDALAELSPSDRELLMLVAWEELTPAEIATSLGLPGTVVRKRLFRARRRLAEIVEQSEDPGYVETTGHGSQTPPALGISDPNLAVEERYAQFRTSRR